MDFIESIDNQMTTTLNGMPARKATANATVDLFFKIGASRGKNIIPDFVAAFVENPEFALRVALWARDVRGGAGERQLFKNILSYLEENQPELAKRLIVRIPELGRWDDMLIEYKNKDVQEYAFAFYAKAIEEGNQLAAKWAPRKGFMAKKLRDSWGMTPKQYRKTIVALTDVVETAMCNKAWDSIPFSKVPSLASSRYKTAFYRNAEAAYTEYVAKLTSGDKSVKVNAGAVYPYDVLKGLLGWSAKQLSKVEKDLIVAQWDALPNYVGDANVFPMVDVSGSMCCNVGGNNSLTCLDVAVSLGLYLADKNTGKMKDAFLTFSNSPEIVKLRGDVVQKLSQMSRSDWGMNTDLTLAFEKMLYMATRNDVPNEDMPKILLILSDMQFDSCVRTDDTALQMIARKYENAGYSMPKVVFWNLNSHDNVPVKFNESGTALISGFSPSIMKAVLSADMAKFDPLFIMIEAVGGDRYAY